MKKRNIPALIIMCAFIVVSAAVISVIHIDSVCKPVADNSFPYVDAVIAAAVMESDKEKRDQEEFAPVPQLVSLGEFTIYHYCPCELCTNGTGITASGTTATEGRTIAADWETIPPDSKVLIGDIWYTVEDKGSGISGNKIDVFIDSHERALELGKYATEIFILEEGKEE